MSKSLRAGIKVIITFTFLCILVIQKSESASVVWSKWLQCVSSWQMVCGIKRRLALATKAHHWFCHFNSSSSSFVLMMMKVSYQCENQIILHKIRFWFERVWLVATSGASVSLCEEGRSSNFKGWPLKGDLAWFPILNIFKLIIITPTTPSKAIPSDCLFWISKGPLGFNR